MTRPVPLGSTPESLRRFGIARRPVLSAVRAFCIACAGTWREAELCECAGCPLWPYRLGRDPWRQRPALSDAAKAELTARLRPVREGG